MDEWEFVRYWFEDGGMEKVQRQYPEYFVEDSALLTFFTQYKSYEAMVLSRLEVLLAKEYGHEPN